VGYRRYITAAYESQLVQISGVNGNLPWLQRHTSRNPILFAADLWLIRLDVDR
jgi:hypothetical protein